MPRTETHARRGSATPLYVYGLVRAADARPLGPIGLDVAGSPGEVTAILADEVAAVVSPSPSRERVPPMRKNLDAQNRVLRELLSAPGGLIPLRFGHVVRSERDVVRLLGPRRRRITEELGKLAGKVEMSLGVSWSVGNLFEYIVGRSPELADLRNSMFAAGRDPGREEKIELGRAFAERLEEERREPVRIVTEALEDCVELLKEIDVRDDAGVLDMAILVRRERREELDRKIEEIAGQFSDAYAFRYTGPFAPFHFAGLSLTEGES